MATPFYPVDLATFVQGSSSLDTTRQIIFGNDSNQYVFPLTFQESDRMLKLKLDKKGVPFNWGAHAPPNTQVDAREITIVGPLGSLVYGGRTNSSGQFLQLLTADDLEAERALLAGLQQLGRQKLWTRWDRYCIAYLEEFDFKFFQDGGAYRYAQWELKFWADDPRYYGKTQSSYSFGSTTSNALQGVAVTQNGNVRAYPIFTFTGTGGTLSSDVCLSAPEIGMQVGSNILTLSFAGLTMYYQDTLVINCDPRPEHRNSAAIYTSNSSAQYNALQYINGASGISNNLDFSEFFPFIPNGTGGCTLLVGATCAGVPKGYSCTITWNDTYL